MPIDDAAAAEIARRARGTPRIVNRLLRRVRDYAQVRAAGTITLDVAHAALKLLEVDEHGFDEVDRKLLRTIIDKFGGGPGRLEHHRRGDQRREGRHRRHLRAVPDSDRLSGSHAARTRGDGAGLRLFRARRARRTTKGLTTVVTARKATRIGGRPTTIRSLATYVPPRRADQRRPREDGRHDRRVDPAAHRHPRAAHRRPGRRDVGPGQGSGAQGDRRARGSRRTTSASSSSAP